MLLSVALGCGFCALALAMRAALGACTRSQASRLRHHMERTRAETHLLVPLFGQDADRN